MGLERGKWGKNFKLGNRVRKLEIGENVGKTLVNWESGVRGIKCGKKWSYSMVNWG